MCEGAACCAHRSVVWVWAVHTHDRLCPLCIARACECAPSQSNSVTQARDSKQSAERAAILQKKAWEKVSVQPLFMTGLMLWMSGSTLNIFSIITVGMAVSRPVTALLGMATSASQRTNTAHRTHHVSCAAALTRLLGSLSACVAQRGRRSTRMSTSCFRSWRGLACSYWVWRWVCIGSARWACFH